MFTGGMFTTWRDRLLLDLAAPLSPADRVDVGAWLTEQGREDPRAPQR